MLGCGSDEASLGGGMIQLGERCDRSQAIEIWGKDKLEMSGLLCKQTKEHSDSKELEYSVYNEE